MRYGKGGVRRFSKTITESPRLRCAQLRFFGANVERCLGFLPGPGFLRQSEQKYKWDHE